MIVILYKSLGMQALPALNRVKNSNAMQHNEGDMTIP